MTTAVRAAAVLGALAAIAGPQAATAAAQSIPPAQRPHSRVVTYDRGDAHIQKLTMAVTRSAGRLHASVALTVRNDSARPLVRDLQIGRCTGGAPATPVCPPTATIHVRLSPGQTRAYTRRVTLRQPPARPDAIQAALVRPGTPQPYGFRSDGLLLLKGDAWRGTGAGRTYGVTIAPGTAARRLNFDIPLIARDLAEIDVKWTGTAAPAGVPTAMSRCAGATCTATALAPARARTGPQEFGDRFSFTRRGADALGLTVGVPGQAPLVQAALPWPS
jgi:hypothetical protein